MSDSGPTTIMCSFQLPREGRIRWLEAWSALADYARTWPECRRFNLLTDHHDERHYVVLSEWNGPGDFNRFVRTVGLEWIGRGLDYATIPTQFSYLDPVPPLVPEHMPPPVREKMPVPA